MFCLSLGWPLFTGLTVFVKTGLDNEKHVSLMKPIYFGSCILVLKQVVYIAKMVLILEFLYSETLNNLFIYISPDNKTTSYTWQK